MIVKESPLKGMTVGTVATVAIRELPVVHAVDLRVAPGSSSFSALAQALDVDIALQPGQTSTNKNKISTLCLAPDWWLVLGYEDALQKLSSLQNNFHFSAVEVSGQRTTIEIEGPYARDVLAHLWEQDLREKSFPVGSVSQGLMAKAPVILHYIAPFRYHIMVRSSFALHSWMALADAVEEWV